MEIKTVSPHRAVVKIRNERDTHTEAQHSAQSSASCKRYISFHCDHYNRLSQTLQKGQKAWGPGEGTGGCSAPGTASPHTTPRAGVSHLDPSEPHGGQLLLGTTNGTARGFRVPAAESRFPEQRQRANKHSSLAHVVNAQCFPRTLTAW